MNEWHRRSVLATGAALSTGGIASATAGASDADEDGDDDLPHSDSRATPEPDEDWSSYRGDAGHARYVRDGPQFEGDSLGAAWSLAYDGTVAIADNMVYTTTVDGVVAVDATDGSLVWETEVDARDPAIAGDMVYLGGDELVALDRYDGSVQWSHDLESDEELGSHTVAYDAVFVVADGTLSALEAADGSVRWQTDSAVIETNGGDELESEWTTGTAAANGVVYAGTRHGLCAINPETGDSVWQRTDGYAGAAGTEIYATSTTVLVGSQSTVECGLYDAHTGENVGTITSETPYEPALSDDAAITGTNQSYHSRSISGDDYDWDLSVTYTYGQAVISSETVYVYFATDGHNYGDLEYDQTLVALDRRDGSEQWSLSRADAPVGDVRAISGETIYVDHDGDLVALRERTGDEDTSEEDDEGAPAEEDEDDDDGGEDVEDGGEGVEDGEDDDAESGCGCPNDGDDATYDGDNSSTDSPDTTADESSDDSNTTTDTDAERTGDDSATDDIDNANETDPETPAAESETVTDSVPGFTAGSGLLGGSLGLEWLRRRQNEDDVE